MLSYLGTCCMGGDSNFSACIYYRTVVASFKKPDMKLKAPLFCTCLLNFHSLIWTLGQEGGGGGGEFDKRKSAIPETEFKANKTVP